MRDLRALLTIHLHFLECVINHSDEGRDNVNKGAL